MELDLISARQAARWMGGGTGVLFDFLCIEFLDWLRCFYFSKDRLLHSSSPPIPVGACIWVCAGVLGVV
jgi:hypothetical protein